MKRSFGIDAVRALSILIVMLRHYGFLTGYNFGVYAIEFLFVISGFLIGQILLNDFYSSDKIEVSSLKRFMVRRWFRILPMYYCAILVKFAIDHSIGWNIFYYVFFLQNHFYGITFYPETWTLVIDEWFYLTIPVLLYLFMRFVSFKKQHVAIFIASIILFINLARAAWVYKSGALWAGLNGNVPFRQDTLLMGVMLAFVKMHYKNWFNRMNTAGFFALAILAFSAYYCLIYSIRTPVDRINAYYFTRTISFSLCSLLIAFTLPYIENSIQQFRSPHLQSFNAIIIWGSKLSYALYLFHTLSHDGVNYVFKRLGLSDPWIGIGALVLATLISYSLYQLLEKKFLIIRDKYFPDRPMSQR